MALTHPEKTRDVAWLVKATKQMLRPVARLLIGKMSCQMVITLLKEVYVAEARRQLQEASPGKKVTKSSLALLTGLDTRAIHAVDEGQKESVEAVDLCPEAAVLNAWYQQDTFREKETGEPAVLPIQGRGISFQTLVTRNAGRNVTCQTVLKRLTESGNLELIGDNHVRLITPHYVPVNSSEQTVLEVGSASIDRLGRTLAHNMADPEDIPRWLHQDRWSRRIPEEKLHELRARVRTLLTEQIQIIENELDAVEAPVKQDNHSTVGIGWFYWEDPDKAG